MNKWIINAFADESAPDLAGQIDALKRNRLQGLEIRNIDGRNIADIPTNEIREIGKALSDNGLKVWSVGSRLGKIQITDDFAPHLEECKRTLEIANMLGADYIRLFSFYIPQGEPPASYRDEVLERLSKFLEASDGSGVKLCHENEKGVYGDIAARCLDIYESLPALGCIFDPANYIQCGQDTEDAFRMLGDRVTYLHIKDALPDGKVVPAGKGAGRLPEILAQYRANGGTGITVEPHLTVFKGLAELERDGEKSVVGENEFVSEEAAFDAAIIALRTIISASQNTGNHTGFTV